MDVYEIQESIDMTIDAYEQMLIAVNELSARRRDLVMEMSDITASALYLGRATHGLRKLRVTDVSHKIEFIVKSKSK